MDNRCKHRRYIGWSISLGLVVLIVVLRIFFFFVFRIPSGQYEHLTSGNYMLMNRQASPQVGRYALLNAWHPTSAGRTLVQIVGGAGDTVTLSRDTLRINSQVVRVLPQSLHASDCTFHVVLPQGRYWALSENRKGGEDSCFRGPLAPSDFYAIAF